MLKTFESFQKKIFAKSKKEKFWLDDYQTNIITFILSIQKSKIAQKSYIFWSKKVNYNIRNAS